MQARLLLDSQLLCTKALLTTIIRIQSTEKPALNPNFLKDGSDGIAYNLHRQKHSASEHNCSEAGLQTLQVISCPVKKALVPDWQCS
jgi:hypothetical protein